MLYLYDGGFEQVVDSLSGEIAFIVVADHEAVVDAGGIFRRPGIPDLRHAGSVVTSGFGEISGPGFLPLHVPEIVQAHAVLGGKQ